MTYIWDYGYLHFNNTIIRPEVKRLQNNDFQTDFCSRPNGFERIFFCDHYWTRKEEKILTSIERVVIHFNFSFLLFHKISNGNEYMNLISIVELQVRLIKHSTIPKNCKFFTENIVGMRIEGNLAIFLKMLIGL